MSNEINKNRRYLPHDIYQNLMVFLEYRSLELVLIHNVKNVKNKKDKVLTLDQDEFIKQIQYDGYILIETKDKQDKVRRFNKLDTITNKKRKVLTFILLLDVGSVHVESTQNLSKLINKIPNMNETQRDYNIDIIIISENKFNTHLEKKVAELKSDGSDGNGYVHIYPYVYFMFSSIRPNHKLIANHTIVDKTEEKKILEKINVKKRNLPVIRKNDVMAVWIGAEIGDIVEIQFQSEATAIETKYCVVKP